MNVTYVNRLLIVKKVSFHSFFAFFIITLQAIWYGLTLNTIYFYLTKKQNAYEKDYSFDSGTTRVLESKYPNVVLNVPAVGTNGEVLLTSKLFYVIWIEKNGAESQLTLDAELYRNATEDMTEIPYAYDDAYDIWAAGEKVYLNQDAEELATWTKIGVQSIYRGGGEEHKSNIGWAETGANGIRNAVVDLNNGKAVIFNIAGQRVKDVRSGLYIVNGKKVVVK